jgi:Kef-type K+ transport system membrane component KefB
MEKSDRLVSPLLALFFVISGAELELTVFTDIAIVGIGLVYILFRSLGKYYGAYTSAKWSKCSPKVCKYLGITLLPQAGVALGMAMSARQLGAEGDLIRNIVLFSVLIYELFGPMLTKMALTKSGDISPMPDHVKNRRETKIQEHKEKLEGMEKSK